jgi:flagellar basal body-associated protein FliL
MRNSTGVYLIIALIIILVLVELLIPVFRGKKPENAQRQGGQEAEDTTNSGTTPSTTS